MITFVYWPLPVLTVLLTHSDCSRCILRGKTGFHPPTLSRDVPTFLSVERDLGGCPPRLADMASLVQVTPGEVGQPIFISDFRQHGPSTIKPAVDLIRRLGPLDLVDNDRV